MAHFSGNKILNFDQVFIVLKTLGSGTFGKVVQLKSKLTGKLYALKILKEYDEAAEKEVGMLKWLTKQPSVKKEIVNYVDFFIYRNHFCILMEFIDGIEINDYFNNQRTLRDWIQFGIWLLTTINHLHQLNVMHHDIKTDNILKTKTGYKLIDFGVACKINGRKYKCTNSRSAILFTPPEILNGLYTDHTNKKWDVYAIGVTLYYLLTECFPYKVNRQQYIIDPQYRPAKSSQLTKEINRVLKGMLDLNVNQRLTAADGVVLMHQLNRLIK